jgi:hypothetical protein
MNSKSLVKLHVDLPNHWAVGGESMWAKPLGENLYQIKNIPFFAYGLNYDDIVKAIAENSDLNPEIIEVVETSGHQTFRIIFTDNNSKAEHIAIIESIRTEHIGYEGWDEDQFTLNVTPSGNYDALFDKLDELELQGILSFESCEHCIEGSFDAEAEES